MRYVSVRLDRCRFGPDKPTCAKCPVHCYQRDSREQIKVVMRYAGPRMMWEHPWLSLWHLLDGWFRRPVLDVTYRKDKDVGGQCAQSNLVTASGVNVSPDPIVEKLKSIANK